MELEILRLVGYDLELKNIVDREIINNETGILIPSKDTNALIKSIEKLILNKELINYLGSNARNFAVKNFNEIDVIKKQISIIEKITQKVL